MSEPSSPREQPPAEGGDGDEVKSTSTSTTTTTTTTTKTTTTSHKNSNASGSESDRNTNSSAKTEEPPNKPRRRIQRKRLSAPSSTPAPAAPVSLPPPEPKDPAAASDALSNSSTSSGLSDSDSGSDSDASVSSSTSSDSVSSDSDFPSPRGPASSRLLLLSPTSSGVSSPGAPFSPSAMPPTQSACLVKTYSFRETSSNPGPPVWTTPTAFLCVAADPAYTDLVDLLASTFALFGAWSSTLVSTPSRKQLSMLIRRAAAGLSDVPAADPSSSSSPRLSPPRPDPPSLTLPSPPPVAPSPNKFVPVPGPPQDESGTDSEDSWLDASPTPPEHATIPAQDPPPPPPVYEAPPPLPTVASAFHISESGATSARSLTPSEGDGSVNTNVATQGSGTSRANRSAASPSPFPSGLELQQGAGDGGGDNEDAPEFGKEFVLYWAGHAFKKQDTLALQLEDGDVFWPVDLMAGLISVLRTQGYTKLLMILDVCYSEYITSSLDLLSKMHSPGSRLEVVIVGSSQGHERTIDGSTDLSTYILKNISRLSPAASASSVSGGQGPSGSLPDSMSAVEQLAWLCYRAELLPKNALTVPRIIEGHSWYTRFLADVQRVEWSDQPASLLVATRALFVDESAGSSSSDHGSLSAAVLDRLTNPHTAWKLFPITGPPNCGKTTWVASIASPSASADSHTKSLAAALVAWCPYDTRSQHGSHDLVEVIVWSLGTTFREYDGVEAARVSTLAKLVQNRTEGRFDIYQWCALLAGFLRTLPETPNDHPVYSIATRDIGSSILDSRILIIDGLLRPSDTRGDVAAVLSVLLTARLPWLRVIAPFLPAYRSGEAFQEVASVVWQDAPKDQSGGAVGRVAPVVDVVEDAGWNVRERVSTMDAKLLSSDSVFDGFARRLFGEDPQHWELASPLLGVMIAAADTLSLPSITVIVERLRDYSCRHTGNRHCRCRAGRVEEMLELLAPLLSVSWDEDRQVTLLFPKFGTMAARIGYRVSATMREGLQDVVEQAHEALSHHFLDAWKDWVAAGADKNTIPEYSLAHLVGHLLTPKTGSPSGSPAHGGSFGSPRSPAEGSALWRLTNGYELVGDWTWFKTMYESEEHRSQLVSALKAAKLPTIVDLVAGGGLNQRELLHRLVALMSEEQVSPESQAWWVVFWASVWGSSARYEAVVPLVSVLMATARIPTHALVSGAVKQWRRSSRTPTALTEMCTSLAEVLELGDPPEAESPDELMARLHVAVKDWVPERIAYKNSGMDIEWGHESLARACLDSWAARDVVSDDDTEDPSTETDVSSVDYAVCHAVYHAVNGAGNEPHASLWRMKLAGGFECVREWDWFHLMLVSSSGHGGMPALLAALRSLKLDDVAEVVELELEPWNMLDRLLLEKCRGSLGAWGEAFEATDLQAWARPVREVSGTQTRTGVLPLVEPEKEVVVTRRSQRGASRRVTVGPGGSLNFWLADGSKRAGGSLPLGNGAVYGCWKGRVVVEPEIAHVGVVGGVHAILATVDVHGVLSIWWDVTSSPRRRLKYRTTLGGRAVTCLCVVSPPEGDRPLVLCGCDSGEVVVFDPVRGREVLSLELPTPSPGAVTGILCVQGSLFVAVGYELADMTVWPLPQRARSVHRALLCGTKWIVPDSPNPVTSVNLTPRFVPCVDLGGGLMIARAVEGSDNQLWVYRWDEGHYHQVGRPVLLDTGTVSSIAIDPNHLDTVEVRYKGFRTCSYKLSL